MDKVLFSHETNDWATPSNLYNLLKEKGYTDPCPLYGITFMDGLSLTWDNVRYFVNPPYSNISTWVDKCINEFHSNLIYLLIPARTDTKYFKRLFSFGCDFIFITGRLHFNDSKNCAPFPSMLVKITGNCSRIYLTDQKDLDKYFE